MGLEVPLHRALFPKYIHFQAPQAQNQKQHKPQALRPYKSKRPKAQAAEELPIKPVHHKLVFGGVPAAQRCFWLGVGARFRAWGLGFRFPHLWLVELGEGVVRFAAWHKRFSRARDQRAKQVLKTSYSSLNTT